MFSFHFRVALCAAVFFIMPFAFAHEAKIGSITVGSPWTRATPKRANVGAGFITIKNEGNAPDKLLKITSPKAARVEIHEMKIENGVMQMRQIKGGLIIPAGETVVLKPGGNHLMFIGLKEQLLEGMDFKTTLIFEKAGAIDFDFHIRPAGSVSDNAHH